MAALSPTERTKEYLEANGWLVEYTEHYDKRSKITRDLFGFVDFLAMKDGDLLALQVTDGTNFSKRVLKVLDSPKAIQVCLTHDVQVWGWKQYAALPSDNQWRARRTRILVSNGGLTTEVMDMIG